ncbi:ATP cone domain-containing protein, partial [Pseudomonadota bacterium]
IIVERSNMQSTPFSRGELRRSLECCGLTEEVATEIVAKIYDHLVSIDTKCISSRELGLLTHRYLRRELSAEAAKRYLVWTDYHHGNRPLLILIGGTPGCGKSTMATELATRLDIVRTQSTDMLREVMRMMLPHRLLPILHTSSFDAWKALPAPTESLTDRDGLLTDGYLTQVELLSVAGEAVLQRALKERVSLILEGVHMHPSFLDNIPKEDDAIVVPIMLSVADKDTLSRRFTGRSKQAPSRRAKRYLDNFEAIWRLQTFLIAEAERAGFNIVTNDNKEDALSDVMGAIIDALSKDFSGTPEEVFV